MSAAKPRVDIDITRERLQRLGLPHAADQLGDALSRTAPRSPGKTPRRIEDLLRGKPPRGILHLHVHRRRPDSAPHMSILLFLYSTLGFQDFILNRVNGHDQLWGARYASKNKG